MVDRRKIGRFEIQKAMGRGSTGAVFQAREAGRGRTVALKAIPFPAGLTAREQQALEQRFLETAMKAAALTHPGIVTLYEGGVDPEAAVFFLAFELVRGQTLAALVAASPPDTRESLRIAAALAEVLQHAHEHGVIHGELEPSSVVLSSSGEPRIADFGVFGWDIAPPGAVIAASAWMSPERVLGKPLDARTDIYSLGAILYELLTGKPVAEAASALELMTKIAYENPAPAKSLARDLPDTIEAVLGLALAKTAAARYPDARSLRDDLVDIGASKLPRYAGSTGLGTARAEALVPSPLSLPTGQRVRIEVRHGQRKDEVLVLRTPRLLIGRAGGGAHADLELPDAEVSRAHALVECFGSRIVLRDLNSTNGTFIGSARITEAELQDGSQFRVGQTSFVLRLEPAD
jgi:serine/threonine protein kinase